MKNSPNKMSPKKGTKSKFIWRILWKLSVRVSPRWRSRQRGVVEHGRQAHRLEVMCSSLTRGSIFYFQLCIGLEKGVSIDWNLEISSINQHIYD